MVEKSNNTPIPFEMTICTKMRHDRGGGGAKPCKPTFKIRMDFAYTKLLVSGKTSQLASPVG